jgi:predicted phage tail protein
MSRLLVGIISAAGGLIIGGFGGRKTSNITMEDVKAAPGKAGSAILGAVKKTGQKIGSGLSSLAFWKKKKEVKKTKIVASELTKAMLLEHHDLGEKYAKLTNDFSETAKRMGLVEIERDDKKELLRQANVKLDTFQNTVDEKDEKLRKAATDLKQANTDEQKAIADKQKAITDTQKAVSDLKIAQTTIATLQKVTPEN